MPAIVDPTPEQLSRGQKLLGIGMAGLVAAGLFIALFQSPDWIDSGLREQISLLTVEGWFNPPHYLGFWMMGILGGLYVALLFLPQYIK